MRIIATRTPGLFDDPGGAPPVALPSPPGFADGSAAEWARQVPGPAVLLGAAVTDGERALLRAMPVRAHPFPGLAAGLFLAVSPWPLGCAEQVAWPHLLPGLAGVALRCGRRPCRAR